MEGSNEFKDLLNATAQRVLRVLDAPAAAGGQASEGRSAWELKIELKVPNALIYLALGALCRDGLIEIAPRELTYRIKRTHAPSMVPGQPAL